MPLLDVDRLRAGYGSIEVLQGITLSLPAASLGLVVGPNGAGKTTLLKAISRMCEVQSGSVRFDGIDVAHLRPHQLARVGVAHVPEGRQLFSRLTVRENLDLGAQGKARSFRAESLDYVYSLFPILASRGSQRAGTLSGGEQQMLVIGRALMSKPRLLLLDEPSTGLAPIVLNSVIAALRRIADDGAAVLLVEQAFIDPIDMLNTVFVLRDGRLPLTLDHPTRGSRQDVLDAYMGHGGERPPVGVE
jgi:branched-chain amino acid transport system ATP-binding protein